MDLIHSSLFNLEIETIHLSSQEVVVVEEEQFQRNWVDLPTDVLSMIFLKLDTNDILVSAQWVCTSWWKLSKQPHLFSCIHVEEVLNLFGCIFSPYFNMKVSEGMAREAIDRSCGQLVEFSVQHIATDELLQYMSEKSRSLKLLRLVTCYEVSAGGLIEVAKKLAQLEQLEIIHCSYFTKDVYETFGRFCPCLKSCRFNYIENMAGLDVVALVIAQTMPELRHLNLFSNNLTDDGLRAILDSCPNLESLDVRRCFKLEFGGDLNERTANITKNLPRDPSDDDDCDMEGYSVQEDCFYYRGYNI